jgi:hypothetical protein
MMQLYFRLSIFAYPGGKRQKGAADDGAVPELQAIRAAYEI